MPGIKSRSAACKASTSPTVLSRQTPLIYFFRSHLAVLKRPYMVMGIESKLVCSRQVPYLLCSVSLFLSLSLWFYPSHFTLFVFAILQRSTQEELWYLLVRVQEGMNPPLPGILLGGHLMVLTEYVVMEPEAQQGRVFASAICAVPTAWKKGGEGWLVLRELFHSAESRTTI